VVYLPTVPVKDQGHLGSCVFNALCAQMEMAELRDNVPIKDFSRLELYYKYRSLQGGINQDTGAYPRVALSVAQKYGVCLESMWPYDVDKFAVEPPKECFEEAMNHQVVKYYKALDKIDFMNALASGLSVSFGFTVFTSFMSQEMLETGIWKGRQPGDKVEGGHGVLAIGYSQHMKIDDNAPGAALVQNSWSDQWGCQPPTYNSRGFFWIPFDWLFEIGGDFQVIQQIEEP
jgi:C1A family cysteine protease